MDKVFLEKMVANKCTLAQIARQLGKSERTVGRALKKFGLKTHRHIDRDPNAKSKVCRYCNTEKPIEDFPIAGTTKGVTYYRNKCNTCYCAMKADRRHKISRWLKDLKKGLACEKCGNADFRVLEFHHSNGDKDFNIGQASTLGYSRKRILEEVKKCNVLCACCHRILHHEERYGQ